MSVVSSFSELWEDEEFSDVTFVTEDNIQIKSHKIILSHSSPFLRDILLKHSFKTITIYLPDILHRELKIILKSIYLGECIIDDELHKDISKIAEDLKIIGIFNNFVSDRKETQHDVTENIEHTGIVDQTHEDIKKFEIIPFSFNRILEKETNCNENKNCQPNFVTNKEHYLKEGISNTTLICKEINEEGEVVIRKIKNKKKGKIKNTQITSRNSNGKYSCNKCHVQFEKKIEVWKHQTIMHNASSYQCDQCDLMYPFMVKLQQHMDRAHNGVLFKCNLCNINCTQKSALMSHKKRMHDSLRYMCEQCDANFWAESVLKTHKKVMHEGNIGKYDCDICGKGFAKNSIVEMHILAEKYPQYRQINI